MRQGSSSWKYEDMIGGAASSRVKLKLNMTITNRKNTHAKSARQTLDQSVNRSFNLSKNQKNFGSNVADKP